MTCPKCGSESEEWEPTNSLMRCLSCLHGYTLLVSERGRGINREKDIIEWMDSMELVKDE